MTDDKPTAVDERLATVEKRVHTLFELLTALEFAISELQTASGSHAFVLEKLTEQVKHLLRTAETFRGTK